MASADEIDEVLAKLLSEHPDSEEGRWKKIADELQKATGEAKSAMWLKNRAKKLGGGDAATALVLPDGVRGAVRVFDGPRGRGLQCTRNVTKGEVLIGIPQDWALGAGRGVQGQQTLALQLIALKAKDDFRARQLPEFLDMPCFWTADELNWLKASQVHQPACNQLPSLKKMFPGKKAAKCSEKEFIWGMCMVQSRTFDAGDKMIFLPFVDLINSEAQPDLGLDIRSSDGYICIHASRNFSEGEEALVNYHGNELPNLFETFLGYGYVPSIVAEQRIMSSSREDLMREAAFFKQCLESLADTPETSDESEKALPHRQRMANALLRAERRNALEHLERLTAKLKE
eukprot:TRINITY_DN15961_c0_g1_i5.p1 TRINITY_DN15961_c0_g1~~TRINITY_DN15961_c0_g1_i5.p1  ORF type:complete len:344 (-),score=58.29 TRINITY_DN15961_c0_g1_i5:41-1072(-)